MRRRCGFCKGLNLLIKQAWLCKTLSAAHFCIVRFCPEYRSLA
ncbi:metalloprotease [Neisseria shayeganii 871]|uniref:Metalloprotease n=1 Tax=Neisseria shayeganii 871 TaxID=1032488 RepID=G4CHJ9_9NEIS|nr:metalloprotease [Neisseria shayeganii 871]